MTHIHTHTLTKILTLTHNALLSRLFLHLLPSYLLYLTPVYCTYHLLLPGEQGKNEFFFFTKFASLKQIVNWLIPIVYLKGFRIISKLNRGCIYGCVLRDFKRKEDPSSSGWYHYMVAMPGCQKRHPDYQQHSTLCFPTMNACYHWSLSGWHPSHEDLYPQSMSQEPQLGL